MAEEKKAALKLKLWSYKGFIQDGRKVKGKVAAYSKQEAIEELKSRGRFVSKIKDATPFDSDWGPPSKEQLSIFLKDLSNKVSTGVGMKSVLIGMKKLNYNFKVILMIEHALQEIDKGIELNEALKNTKKFSSDTIEIIKAGEKSGKLSMVLNELSILYAEEAHTRKILIKSSFKPVGMVVFAILIIVFVIPQMIEPIRGVYAEFKIGDKGLPALTEWVMATVNFVAGAGGLLVLAILIGLVVLYKFSYKKYFGFKSKMDHFFVALPLFGNMKAKLFTYITFLTFNVLYKSSIDVSMAFKMMADSQKNESLKNDLLSVYNSLKSGKELNVSIEQSLFISEPMKDKISNGYKDGSLGEELDSGKILAKRDFNEYTEVFIKGVVALIGIVVSLVVGVIIISVYLPMFTMIKDVMDTM